MGKKSVKENKNIYFLARENAGLTRAEASEKTFISESRIEKIEYDKSAPRPDEVIAMARVYNSASICNYFCSHASLNVLDEQKNRLIAISADGIIDETEMHDLAVIRSGLRRISMAIDSFDLWVEDQIASGIIDGEALEQEIDKL